MDWLKYLLVWLSRITHCRGFGVQSPADYYFVRYVVNEHWSYYAYATLGKADSWRKRKIGLLCFRLTNWLQPQRVIDGGGMSAYVTAACARTLVLKVPENRVIPDCVELAILPVTTDVDMLFNHCGDHSVVLFLDIDRHKACWQQIAHDPRVTISYDLYYCGIVMFDSRRSKQHYKINF